MPCPKVARCPLYPELQMESGLQIWQTLFCQTDSKFESCPPDSCSIALATSADGAGTSPPRFFWHEIDAILPRKARDKND